MPEKEPKRPKIIIIIINYKLQNVCVTDVSALKDLSVYLRPNKNSKKCDE